MSYKQHDIQPHHRLVDGLTSRPNTHKDGLGLYLCPLLDTDGKQKMNIDHTTQNADGTGNAMGQMLDSSVSHLQHVVDNTQHVNSRLNTIQNVLHQNGDGTGTTHGEMLDSVSSKLGDISSNSVLTASRLNNLQNLLTADGVGGGAKLGVIATNSLTKLTEIDTAIDTIDGVLDSSLTKLTEIDTAIDVVDAVLDASLVKQTNIETLITTTNTKIEKRDTPVTLIANASTAEGVVSSVIDMDGYKNIVFYGVSSSATPVLAIMASNLTGGTYYRTGELIPKASSVGGTEQIFLRIENVGVPFLKVENTTGTITYTLLYTRYN